MYLEVRINKRTVSYTHPFTGYDLSYKGKKVELDTSLPYKGHFNVLQTCLLYTSDNEVFAVATIFEVEPKNPRDIGDLVNWGIYGDDGLIHCNWTFIIRKIDGNKYKLIDIKAVSYTHLYKS